MAYASASSPFAGVKGQNVLSKTTTTAPLLSPPLNQEPVLPLSSPFITSPTTPKLGSSTSAKSFGFGAFASASSPFASVAASKPPVLGSTLKLGRAKSPSRRGQSSAHPNAFSPYASGVQGFAIASKRARAGSPASSSRSSLERNGSFHALENNNTVFDSEPEDEQEDGRASSFGERLRAGRDDHDENKSEDEQTKVVLTEQDGGLYRLHIVLSVFMASFSSCDG